MPDFWMGWLADLDRQCETDRARDDRTPPAAAGLRSVIDATKVARTALQNAAPSPDFCSRPKLMVEKAEDRPAPGAAGAGGGMGEMSWNDSD